MWPYRKTIARQWKDAADSQTNARFVFTGTTAHSLLLDDFSVSRESLLFPDADRDGLPDEWEKSQDLDPASSGRDDDPDADGLTNVEELVLGTRPLIADSDGDGASDGGEILAGRNPTRKEQSSDPQSDKEGKGLAAFLPGGSDPGISQDGDGFVTLGELRLVATRAWHEFESCLFGGAGFVLPSFPQGGDARKVSFEEALGIASPFWARLNSVSGALSREIVSQLDPALDSAVPWNQLVAAGDRKRPLTATHLRVLFGFDLRADRDGDGLSDWQEWQLRKSATAAEPEADEDGDSFSNIVEAANGTDAGDPRDNPATRRSAEGGEAATEGAVDVFTSFQGDQDAKARRVLRERRGGGVFDIGAKPETKPKQATKADSPAK